MFVHYSQIVSSGYKTLQEGQSVSFDQISQEKGLQARNVEAVQA